VLSVLFPTQSENNAALSGTSLTALAFYQKFLTIKERDRIKKLGLSAGYRTKAIKA
jgi:hypothetical protein